MARATNPMICPDCGLAMNHHAAKLIHPTTIEEAAVVDPALGGMIEETHTCPGCGKAAARRIASVQ
jgi:hypothetical protein